MASVLMSRLWEAMGMVPDMPSGHRLILMAYANHANKESGLAWPSHETAAARSGLARTTVARAVPVLARAGWLVPVGTKPSGVIVYRPAVPAAVAAALAEAVAVRARCALTLQQVCSESTAGVLSEHTEPCHEPVHEPLLPAEGRAPVGDGVPALQRGRGERGLDEEECGLRPAPAGKIADCGMERQNPEPLGLARDKPGTRNAERAVATQLPLFSGSAGEQLSTVLGRVPEGDRVAVWVVGGVGLREHGPRALGVFLRQVAAWPGHRWGAIKHVPAYLASTLARCARETSEAEEAEREARVRRELAMAEADRRSAAEQARHARRHEEAGRLAEAFQALSEADRAAVVSEAWEAMPPVRRCKADRSVPLYGFLGREVLRQMGKRAPPA